MDQHALLSPALHEIRLLLETSLGPLGADKVVETDANAILVTNTGRDLLEALHPSSGLLTLVLSSLKEFACLHGDGTKRAAILVSSGLSEALRVTGASETSLTSLAITLNALNVSGYLGGLLNRASTSLSTHLSLGEGEGGTVRGAIESIVGTHLTNKVGSRAHRHLSKLVTDLIMDRLEPPPSPLPLPSPSPSPASSTIPPLTTPQRSSVWEAISELIYGFKSNPGSSHPPILPLCLLPGSNVTQSRLIDGLVIRQRLASPHMASFLSPGFNPGGEASGINFVVLSCALDSTSGGTIVQPTPSIGGAASNGEWLREAAAERARSIRTRLAVLKSRGVSLILSTETLNSSGGLLPLLCLEDGLALIQGVDPDEASALCSAAQVAVTTSSTEVALDQAHMGRAQGCSHLPLGRPGEYGLVLEGIAGKGGKTLIVCAPSEGLCRQYGRFVLSSCLAVLAAADARGLCVVPGGAAFDAALSLLLDRNLGTGTVSGTTLSPLDLPSLFYDKLSNLTPALKVIKAMTTASLMALAKTGSQRPLALVTQLLDCHKQHDGLGCRAGLVHRSTVNGAFSSVFEVSSDGGGDGSIVLEPRDLLLSIWQHSVSLLVQVIRVKGHGRALRQHTKNGRGMNLVATPQGQGQVLRVKRGLFSQEDSSGGGSASDDSSEE